MKKILLIEDDHALSNGIALSLKSDYTVLQAASLTEAKDMPEHVDLIILDINLPDGNGLDFFRSVKDRTNTPVIFLTANDLESDIVAGLEMGADDYITKPFSLAVLRARVNTVLRRCETGGRKALGPFLFDFENMIFTKDGTPFELSRTEQKLLFMLVSNPGQTLTRDRLIDCIWSCGAVFVDENALSVSISRLRNKLEDNPKKPVYIKTVYGIGYQWESGI